MRPAMLVVCAFACSRPVAPPVTTARWIPPYVDQRNPVRDAVADDEGHALVDPPLVPDVTYPPKLVGVRWLPRAPALEPHAELARIYGTTRPWTELCAARGMPREVDADEASEYVAAWCAARTGDDRARDRIASLRNARSHAIADAARWDTVDLAAEFAANVVEAMRIVGRDSDALAATYVELGRITDAQRVLETLTRTTDATRACRAMALALAIGSRGDRETVANEAKMRAYDPTCAALHNDLACPLVTGRWEKIECRQARCALAQVAAARATCAPLLRERPELAPILVRDGLVVRWPLRERTAAGWLEIAHAALSTIAVEEGLALAIAALTNASRVASFE